MVNCVPLGASKLVTPSEWKNWEIFLNIVKHLIQNDAGSKDIPQLIVMDSDQSPSNFDDVDLKGKNTSTVITFSLHCPHKMQSFNSRVSGHLKYYHKKAVSEWNLNNFWENSDDFLHYRLPCGGLLQHVHLPE